MTPKEQRYLYYDHINVIGLWEYLAILFHDQPYSHHHAQPQEYAFS